MSIASAWELADLECRIKALKAELEIERAAVTSDNNALVKGFEEYKRLEAENERLKTNIQLLGDELNSLADRYDNLDDENEKLMEVVGAVRLTMDFICSGYPNWEEPKHNTIYTMLKEALKGLEVEK